MGKRKASDFEVRGPDDGYAKYPPTKPASGSSYAEKLRDPRWQKKRLEIMERDGFACRECGDDGSTLNVHHAYYKRGYDPWEYPSSSLVTLCHECHGKYEESREELLGSFVKLSLGEQSEVCMVANDAQKSIRYLDKAGVCPAYLLYELHTALMKGDDPNGDYEDISLLLAHWDEFRPAIQGIISTAFRVSSRAAEAATKSLKHSGSSGQDLAPSESPTIPVVKSGSGSDLAAPSIIEMTGFFPQGATEELKNEILAELIAAKRRQQGIVCEEPKKIPVAEVVQ